MGEGEERYKTDRNSTNSHISHLQDYSWALRGITDLCKTFECDQFNGILAAPHPPFRNVMTSS